MVIPAGPEDITAEWITLALRDGGAISRANVGASNAHRQRARVAAILDHDA